MQSQASDVDAYLAEVDATRRDVLTAVRGLCVEILTGYEESMRYGMPTYTFGNRPTVAFASQKKYISLYILNEQIAADHPELVAGLNFGKCCLRYTIPAKIDLAVVRRLLELRAAGE